MKLLRICGSVHQNDMRPLTPSKFILRKVHIILELGIGARYYK